MANLSHSESRRLYSWWWDSHNSPKNSKWLMDNLTDMDVKVKSMIKLIEEDADSFARRAEMYYKKRPELMKLVEDFYRAYRALAERYNHATGELRHAHRTIAKAFPDQDSPMQNGHHTPEIKCTARVLSFDSDDEGDSEVGPGKTGSNAFENEARFLRKALADMKAEKDEVLVKYQNCLSKLSNIERELENAEKDSIRLNEKANRAEIEVETLKENLVRLNDVKNAGLEKISSLKSIISRETKSETQNLKDEISRLEVEKQRVVLENEDFLEKISVLENVISVMENEARLLKIQAEESENEIVELKKSIADLNNEKEKSARKYKCCLETISKLEKDLSNAKMDVKRLTNDVLVKNSKFDDLEMSNLSLRAEANNLAEKIITKDRELSEKQVELENLQRNLRDEHLKYKQIAADLDNLQNVHSKSRDDQRDLELELKNAIQMLNDSKISKNEAQISMENMQNEITSLKEIKERLENKVSHHIGLNDSLQNEILRLKDEIERLNKSYGDLIEQIEQSGLDPKCLGFSVKNLYDENSKMKRKYEDESNEKMVLLKKLENVENVLSNSNAELENSREKVESLRESCEFLNDEKRALISEKASYMSQLNVITENLHDLLGKNAVLENCLSTARVELEGLREKSKGLEEICELLKDERSYLLSEKRGLVLKLENVERKLEITEKRFTGLEEKYADLENEKKAADCELEELKFDRKKYDIQNESILIGLENQIRILKDENGSKTKEYEDELDKGLKAQFEISILQKFMKDFEEKNYALIIECQKHVEASKLSEKVISELESESLEQQIEAEMLLDEIERLRNGIYEVIRAVDPDCDPVVENDGTFVNHVVERIEDMKSSISRIGNLEREFETMAKNLDLAKNEKDETLEMNERLRSNLIESNRRADLLESELTNLKRDNGILLKKFSDVNEEKYVVNQQNDAILLEFLATDNKSMILTRFGEEKVIEMKLLLEDLNKQHKDNISLEHEIKVVRENLELQKAQTLLLRDDVRKSEIEMQKTREYNVRMKRNLLQTQAKLMQTESKLESSEHLRENLEKNILELSENNSIQKREIEGLSTVNANLQSKLEAKNDEFEAFFFDSQISSIHEVLYENTLKEVSGACRYLENESSSKTLEIERMKAKICSMEREMNELKSKINAYDPVVAGLRDDITLLEQNAVLQAKLKAARNRNQELELLEVSGDLKTRTSDILHEDQSLISLKNLHARIKSVGKMIEESNKPASRRRSNAKKHESINVEIEHLKTRRFLGRKKPHADEDIPKLHNIKTKDIPLDHVSNNANVSVEKGDQMLELWEVGAKNRRTIGDSIKVSYRMIENDGFENLKRISSPPSTDPDLDKDLGFDMLEVSSRISEASKEVNKRRVLERLTSDAQKLENLQTNVEILKTKLETCKKGKNVDFETVQEQLSEIEETVANLTYTNGQLVRKLQECPSPGGRVSPRRRKIVEQARKGSERIARLELEFQKIQFIVMKMEDDKKKNKGKIKFLRNKSVVLRDFIYNGKRVNSVKGKKGPLCGCLKPSASRNGFSSPY